MTDKPTDAELVEQGRSIAVARSLTDLTVYSALNRMADRIEQLSAQVAALQAKEGGGPHRPDKSRPDNMTPTRPDAGPGGVPDDMSFQAELAALLNRRSAEAGSNTPDFILAEYLAGCLVNFNVYVNAREQWYGRPKQSPSPPAPETK